MKNIVMHFYYKLLVIVSDIINCLVYFILPLINLWSLIYKLTHYWFVGIPGIPERHRHPGAPE